MTDQYDKLMQRKAFMENYRKEAMFRDSLEEFDDSRETVRQLIEEYSEAEKEQYLEWGSGAQMGS
jgi:tubulin gamma